MRPFPMTLPPLILLSGHSFSQETKWFSVFHLLISHPTSLTTVIAVITSMPFDLSQVSTGHAKQPFPQVKLWIAFLLLAPSLSGLFRQSGPLGAILELREVLCQLLIALRYLFLAKLVSRLFLPQHKQLILLPIALRLRDLLLAGLNPAIPIRRQFPGIPFSIQNRFQDGLTGHPADVADHVGQLDIHLRQRLLHPLNMANCTAHQILALPPVRPQGANLLRRAKRISQ